MKLAERQQEIIALAGKYGASNVRVFGSHARGDADDKSDLDLLVDLDPGRTLLDPVALWQDLEELLACRVDLVVSGGISPYLRERMLSEARPL